MQQRQEQRHTPTSPPESAVLDPTGRLAYVVLQELIVTNEVDGSFTIICVRPEPSSCS
jgi:hypothetical protein